MSPSLSNRGGVPTCVVHACFGPGFAFWYQYGRSTAGFSRFVRVESGAMVEYTLWDGPHGLVGWAAPTAHPPPICTSASLSVSVPTCAELFRVSVPPTWRTVFTPLICAELFRQRLPLTYRGTLTSTEFPSVMQLVGASA